MPQTVLREVARYFELKEEKLSEKWTGQRDERAVAMELMYRHGAASQAEIGRVLGDLDYTAVSRERKRLREKSRNGKEVKKGIERNRNSRNVIGKDSTP